jgi:hypothetical protein
MLGKNVSARVREISLTDAVNQVTEETISIVSHQVTASMLSAVVGRTVAFNRVNVVLRGGDSVIVFCVNFRADVAREFTAEEVASAGIRCFRVECYD